MAITRLQLSGEQLKTLMSTNNAVPCNGCRECCKGDMIALKPEFGDNPANYKWHRQRNPVTGRLDMVVDHKENGECVYLDEHGCTIHGRAPAVCREFDCRIFFKTMTRPQRRELVKNGAIKKSVIDAGRARLNTLAPKEET